MNAVRLEAEGTDQLVERETELRLLTRLIGDLELGHGGSALVLGPAGSGRTALLEQVASLAGERGLQVFAARGSATESQLPYGLLSQLLASIPELADVPWLRAALSDGTDVQVLHELLCQRLLESARRCPVVLVVDDLILADDQSVAWLAALQRRRGHDPVLLVAAHSGPQDDGCEDSGPLSLAGLPWENRHVVRLRPLS
ncbi:ATP-binding protein, partial [Amycolatopsis pittospori]|uniref:ATP-binding protein n=1 Tax=Amycolatopsis pittospori TaxID=2749434 RepID=UPI0015F0ABE1